MLLATKLVPALQIWSFFSRKQQRNSYEKLFDYVCSIMLIGSLIASMLGSFTASIIALGFGFAAFLLYLGLVQFHLSKPSMQLLPHLILGLRLALAVPILSLATYSLYCVDLYLEGQIQFRIWYPALWLLVVFLLLSMACMHRSMLPSIFFGAFVAFFWIFLNKEGVTKFLFLLTIPWWIYVVTGLLLVWLTLNWAIRFNEKSGVYGRSFFRTIEHAKQGNGVGKLAKPAYFLMWPYLFWMRLQVERKNKEKIGSFALAPRLHSIYLLNLFFIPTAFLSLIMFVVVNMINDLLPMLLSGEAVFFALVIVSAGCFSLSFMYPFLVEQQFLQTRSETQLLALSPAQSSFMQKGVYVFLLRQYFIFWTLGLGLSWLVLHLTKVDSFVVEKLILLYLAMLPSCAYLLKNYAYSHAVFHFQRLYMLAGLLAYGAVLFYLSMQMQVTLLSLALLSSLVSLAFLAYRWKKLEAGSSCLPVGRAA
jgi:hypothetical protein